MTFLPLLILLMQPAFSTAAVPSTGSVHGVILESNGQPSADAIVYLNEPAASTETMRASIKQLNMKFQPEFLAVPVGSTVTFPNLDPFFHNIYSLSPIDEFDLGMFGEGTSAEKTFNSPGVIDIFCAIHPAMHARIFVRENAAFTKTDANGRFHLEVPAGENRISAWSPKSGVSSRTIDIPPGEDVRINFRAEPPPPPKGKP